MTEPAQPPAPRRLLRLPTVKERVGYTASSIYRLMEIGQFPKPIPMGGRAVGWLESEIEAWIDARIQNRSAA